MSQYRKILIVGSGQSVHEFPVMKLQSVGYEVKLADNVLLALRAFHTDSPNLVVVNRVLSGGLDCLTLCRRIREFSNVPIIVLSEDWMIENEVVEILNAGADNYLNKPANLDKILARIKFYLPLPDSTRRWNKKDTKYDDGYLSIDLDNRKICVQGIPISLTPNEYMLLSVLFENAGCVMSPNLILNHVWRLDFTDDRNYLRPFVARLRVKIEPDAFKPLYIVTVHGVGYRFEKQKLT